MNREYSGRPNSKKGTRSAHKTAGRGSELKGDTPLGKFSGTAVGKEKGGKEHANSRLFPAGCGGDVKKGIGKCKTWRIMLKKRERHAGEPAGLNSKRSYPATGRSLGARFLKTKKK